MRRCPGSGRERRSEHTCRWTSDSRRLWRGYKTREGESPIWQASAKEQTLLVRVGVPRLESWGGCQFRYLFRGSRLGSAFHAGTNAFTQHGNFVKGLPGGVDIGAAEVAEGGGGLEDGATQVQGLDDGSRAQVKVFVDQAHDFLV